MGHAVAFAAVLPAGAFSGFVEVADFELKLDEAVVAFARNRSGGNGGFFAFMLLIKLNLCKR